MNIKPGDKATLNSNWVSTDNDAIHLVKKVYEDDKEVVITCSCDTIPFDCIEKADNEQAITCSECLHYLSEA